MGTGAVKYRVSRCENDIFPILLISDLYVRNYGTQTTIIIRNAKYSICSSQFQKLNIINI